MGAWTGPGANNQIQQIHVMGSDGTGPMRDTARFTSERKRCQVLLATSGPSRSSTLAASSRPSAIMVPAAPSLRSAPVRMLVSTRI